MNKEIFIYRIDRSDHIVGTENPGQWRAYAEENAWEGSTSPEDVVGREIWDFIQGPETRHLYREIFKRIRAGTPSLALPFRCDSPGEHRHHELRMTALADDQIEIISTLLRSEPRTPVPLLDSSLKRSAELVTICSMCKKIRIRPSTWVEIEEGVAHFNLFEADPIPGLTHGLCETCYDITMRELDALAPSRPCPNTLP